MIGPWDTPKSILALLEIFFFLEHLLENVYWKVKSLTNLLIDLKTEEKSSFSEERFCCQEPFVNRLGLFLSIGLNQILSTFYLPNITIYWMVLAKYRLVCKESCFALSNSFGSLLLSLWISRLWVVVILTCKV